MRFRSDACNPVQHTFCKKIKPLPVLNNRREEYLRGSLKSPPRRMSFPFLFLKDWGKLGRAFFQRVTSHKSTIRYGLTWTDDSVVLLSFAFSPQNMRLELFLDIREIIFPAIRLPGGPQRLVLVLGSSCLETQRNMQSSVFIVKQSFRMLTVKLYDFLFQRVEHCYSVFHLRLEFLKENVKHKRMMYR